MATARINGVDLFYEETGEGTPLVFIHEFAGDYRSWEHQVRHFSRRYRVVVYNARGYPPSEIPEDPAAYSQDLAVADLLGILDHLKIEKAHIVGFSMGGFAALIFGLRHPERARSLVLAGCGYGSSEDRGAFERDVELVAQRLETEGMERVAEFYARGPTRVQFMDKDPKGWQQFFRELQGSSAQGHAHTLRGVQKTRPSVLDLGEQMKKMTVPTLIITGDEDEPCLDPGLFMKRTIPSSALVVLPKTGHTLNLEEPAAFQQAVQDFVLQVDSGRWTLRNPASLAASSILPEGEGRS